MTPETFGPASVTAWLPLVRAGEPFELAVVPGTRSAGPVLVHGGEEIWGTLSIAEHVADSFPRARLWPEGDLAKALARRLALDAHWSFQALAEALPFDAGPAAPVLSPAALAEVQRVREAVRRCARHRAAPGPYLFGAFSVADAAFAPLVLRLVLHGIELEDAAVMQYMAAIVEDDGMRRWFAAAEATALRVAS